VGKNGADSTAGGGGGGGAGGYGVLLTGGSSLVIDDGWTIRGGDGGTGGIRGALGAGGPNNGGNGGGGGIGISQDGGSLDNRGAIFGGNGGISGNGGVSAGGAGGSGASLGNADIINSGRIVGGNGGSGRGTSGMGGVGLSLKSGSVANDGSIAGGNGGSGYAGGSGGDGGVGIEFTSSGVLTNDGTVSGGTAATTDPIHPPTVGGSGIAGTGFEVFNNGKIVGGNAATSETLVRSYGGAGIAGTGFEVFNNGKIDGGNGTTIGPLVWSYGGVGIIGNTLNIHNNGTISGGLGISDITISRADAIVFTGGTNRLELQSGSKIEGNAVVGNGATGTLALGGDSSPAVPFDVSKIVTTATPGAIDQFVGFNVFEKTGASTWTLTNTTAAVTPWTLKQGTLSVSSDASLGDASGVLTFDGGTLQVTGTTFTSTARDIVWGANGGGFDVTDLGTVFTVMQNLTGAGGLTKTGAGNLILSGTNTYTGATTVSAGTLAAGASNVFSAASAHDVAGGATLDLGGFDQTIGSLSGSGTVRLGTGTLTTGGDNTSTVFSGSIGGTGGSLVKAGSGVMTLSGSNTYTGATTVSAGTLAAGAANAFSAASAHDVAGGAALDLGGLDQTIGSLSGSGMVRLGAGMLTTGGDNTSTVFSGSIGGTGGSLTKVGSGTLTLDGVNTYTGGTTVSAGTLEVGDADHPSTSILGDVQVNAAGTLRGHGSIAGNVNNTGTVWPGGSIGTLTIGGNYTQGPGGTLQVEVSPTVASQLKVGGAASLAGTLSLLYAPGTYTTKAYTLISAGSVKGTFSTVTGNAPSGMAQGIAYAPNAVDLNLATSAQSVQPTQPVVVAPTQATIFGAMGSSALRAGQGVNDVLLERLAGPCGVAAANASPRAAAAGGGAAGTSAAANGQGSGAATTGTSDASAAATSHSTAQSLACPRQGNGLWIQAQGTDTHIDGNHGAPDARDRRYGFLTGVDHQWKGWTIGVAGGYSHADVTESGNGSKGTLDTLRLAGYAAKNLGAYTLAGTLGYAYDFSSTTRSFGALGSARGDGHGQEFTAGLQASRAWSLGPVVLTPRVGVRYAYLDGLGTDESGPTAQNLHVANQHLQSLQPYVGVTLDYPFTLRNNDRPASIQLRAGYAYETQSTGRNVSVTAADGTGFVIAGTRDTRGLVTAGLGAMLPIGKSASAYVRYDSVLHTGNVNAQSLQAGVDYRF